MKRFFYTWMVLSMFGGGEVLADTIKANFLGNTPRVVVAKSYFLDGFVYEGTISLTNVETGEREVFYRYSKDGIDYVSKTKRGPLYKLERSIKIEQVSYLY